MRKWSGIFDMTCDTHVKRPSCMIGKVTSGDLPKTKKDITKPLYQINMDSFSLSVKSIEGYFYRLVSVDADSATGYRWIHGLKTKEEALYVVKGGKPILLNCRPNKNWSF